MSKSLLHLVTKNLVTASRWCHVRLLTLLSRRLWLENRWIHALCHDRTQDSQHSIRPASNDRCHSDLKIRIALSHARTQDYPRSTQDYPRSTQDHQAMTVSTMTSRPILSNFPLRHLMSYIQSRTILIHEKSTSRFCGGQRLVADGSLAGKYELTIGAIKACHRNQDWSYISFFKD